MIGRLKGILLEKQPPEILLDVQGVGYELLLPMTSFYDLPEIGQETTLFTHLVVREDAHLLFGFAQKTDRTLFRELIKTNGVGPKLALAILSAMSVEQFAYAIEREELSKLVKIPGVGKKTAERLLVELKGKFKDVRQSDFFVESKHIPSTSELRQAESSTDEAIAALVAFLLIMMVMNAYSTKLGYEVVKTQQAVVQLTKDNDALDVEVASLKSPVRIQQIAEQQLGMVLPDSFVYSTKSAVTERTVQEKQQIID